MNPDSDRTYPEGDVSLEADVDALVLAAAPVQETSYRRG